MLPEGTAVVSGQPDGLAFEPATRTLSGTPSAATNGPVTIRYADQNLSVKEFTITINPSSSDPPGSSLAFTATVADQEYTAGAVIDSLVLPLATGGTGTLRYSLLPSLSETLPGLMFDPSTRTISGIPLDPTEDAVQFTYLVTDDDGKAATLSFSIKVNPELEITGGSLFDILGSSKVVPTALAGIGCNPPIHRWPARGGYRAAGGDGRHCTADV